MSRNRRRNQGSKQSQGQQLARNFNEIRSLRFKWEKYVETLILNRIKWTGLPDTVDERFLELTLYREGRSVFYDEWKALDWDKEKGYLGVELSDEPLILGTKGTPRGPMDLYGNYTSWNSTGPGGHFQEIAPGEAIVCWDSKTRYPSVSSVNLAVEHLAELDWIALINRRQQRFAPIIAVSENAQADAKMMEMMLDSGKPWMMTLKDFGENIKADLIDLSTDYLQKDFQEDRMNTLNQLLSELGIKNQPFEKSQYQHLDEVIIANDSISRVREDLLSQRRLAAKLMNEKWGLDVSVDWNNDQYELLENGPSAEISEIDNTETVTEGEEK